MEAEKGTTARGSAESAAWFHQQLDNLGLGQSELARKMLELGDDRKFDRILRNIQRMANGDARVSGEMRVMLAMMAAQAKQAA